MSEKSSLPQPQPAGIRVKNILLFGGIVVVLVALALIVVRNISSVFERLAQTYDQSLHPSVVQKSVRSARADFPRPREDVRRGEDLKTFRARELERLSTYGWVNRSNGIVHIPIERAMMLLSGEAARSNAFDSNAAPSMLELQQQRPNQTTNPAPGVTP